MWPKALAQLLELTPHISRLMPLADRFFQTKAQGEDTTRLALERKLDEVASALRTDIATAAASANAGVAQELQDLTTKVEERGVQLTAITAELRSQRTALAPIGELGTRLAQVEAKLDRPADNNLRIVLVLVAIQMILIVVLFIEILFHHA